MSELDRMLLDRLAARHGDAFYLLDPQRFASNCRTFRDELRRCYRRSDFAYSYKTNYTPALCREAHRLGGYAEVVSEMEYGLARRLGVPGERIIFNGPLKPPAVLERSLLEGATVHVDSEGEARRIESIARRHPGRRFALGLRCNLDVGTAEPSRFGVDLSSDEGLAVLERLRRIESCDVGGLHCHICVPDKSLTIFDEISRRMLELTRRHFPDAPPRFVNLGGGFYSPMPEALRRQFNGELPTFAEYADTIAPRFAAAYPAGDGPELIIEPGISVVADTMRFVARVGEIKRLRSRSVAVVTGSVYNVKPTKSSVDMPLTVVRAGEREPRANRSAPLDIVGYTCMEDDCLHAGWGGGLATGDYVVFENVGAYTVVLKPPFIEPCPPVLVAGDGPDGYRLAKRRETADDVFATFESG